MSHLYILAVIVPCYNEANRLNSELWNSYIKSHQNFIFIFVDDGSIDNTDVILSKISELQANVQIIKNEKNQGKSGAVHAGFSYAKKTYRYNFIAFMDADLSLPLHEIDRFIEIITNNTKIHILLGSRVQMLGKKIKRNLLRHYISRVVATLICKIIDEPVYDTQCGLKIFQKDIADLLMQKSFISKWLFDVEILARYKIEYGTEAFNERILEAPVLEWTEKENSKLKFYQFPQIIYELIKINRNYLGPKNNDKDSPTCNYSHIKL